MKRALVRLLFGLSRLRTYERLCVEAVRTALPEDARSILDSNLAIRGFVQRTVHDKLVLFRWIEDKDESRLLRFPNRGDGVYFARIQLSDPGGDVARADLVLHDGMLYSLEFNRSPTRELRGPLAISTLTITEDVMKSSPVLPSPIPSAELQALFPGVAVTSILPSADEDAVQQFQERVGGPIPDELRRLLTLADGFQVEAWSFRGTGAQRLIFPDYHLWAVAESEEHARALCLMEGESTGALYLYDSIDERLAQVEAGFLAAFRTAVQNSKRVFSAARDYGSD